MAEERLRQQHAHLLAALKLPHRPLMKLVRDVEPLEQDRRVALRRIAVLLADDAFELAQAHAVFVRHVRLCIELVALGERAPEPRVAHDDGVDHARKRSNAYWSLVEHAELVGAHHGVPCCGGSSPVSSFINVDLPAPFGPLRPYRGRLKMWWRRRREINTDPVLLLETPLTEIMSNPEDSGQWLTAHGRGVARRRLQRESDRREPAIVTRNRSFLARPCGCRPNPSSVIRHPSSVSGADPDR